MKNTTNGDLKYHLIDFEEYINSDIETSNYKVPYSPVVAPPDDKGWKMMKSYAKKGPRWGLNFKKQEKINNKKGLRDGKTGNKPHDDGKNSQINK